MFLRQLSRIATPSSEIASIARGKVFCRLASHYEFLGSTNYIKVPEIPSEYKREGETNEDRKSYSYLVSGAAFVSYTAFVKNFADIYISTLAPTPGELMSGSTEVDISKIEEGKTQTVVWRKKPVFIRHRTDTEIDAAVADDSAELRDPEPDSKRSKNPSWLVLVGICTHLGCVPLSNQGDYNGWFCPCHGSHYDLSGRIRKGPAPKNLEVPPHRFDSEEKLVIGEE